MNKNYSKYSTFLTFFSLVGFSTILKRAGIYKKRGLCSVEMFKEHLVSILIGKSVNKYTKSGKALNTDNGISKSSMYRFMSSGSFSWRSFLYNLAFSIVSKINKFNNSDRIKCLIVDDSVIHRDCSKKSQLLAKVFDHSSHTYHKGYQLLCLCWSDGISNLPIDFAMMSSKKDKNCLNPIDPATYNKKTSLGKRIDESRRPKTEVVVEMISRALKKYIPADYVLFDTWFTNEPLIAQIKAQGLHVIGMLKHMHNTSYHYKDGQKYNLKALFEKLDREHLIDTRNNIMGSVIVSTKKEKIPVKLLFVKNKNNANKHICLLSTDCSLTNEQIIRTYARRWSIEVNFYNQKEYLGLESGSSANQYSSIIAHATMTCACSMLIEFIKRCNEDIRSFGAVFEDCKEELQEIHINIALDTLMNTFIDYVYALRDKKYLKKGCFDKALNLAKEKISSWFTQQIEYVKNFISSIKEDLFPDAEKA